MYDDDEIKELLTKRKVLSITQDTILELLMELNGFKTIINRNELPEGYLLSSVYYDSMTNTFKFTICHDSFDVVDVGECAPDWENWEQLLNPTSYKIEKIDSY
jgi:hypothetical protein